MRHVDIRAKSRTSIPADLTEVVKIYRRFLSIREATTDDLISLPSLASMQ